MRFKVSELTAAFGGTLHGDDANVDGISIDSRTLESGQLFVAIRSQRNGHDFINDAVKKGAIACLSDGSRLKKTPTIVVDDTVIALGRIGALARSRMPDRVVAITGSTGKTTTKTLLGAMAANVGAAGVSPQSYNNSIGVPLALANAPDDTFTAVLEMGARFKGDIETLCEIAHPTIGIVTNVGLEHAATFGGPEQSAHAKGALVESLPAHGTAVLNVTDDVVYSMHRRTDAHVITFGLDAGDVRASNIRVDKFLRPSFRLHAPNGTVNVNMKLHGIHNVMNALAATAGANALHIGMHDIVDGLETTMPPDHRMQIMRGNSGFLLVDDTYNANPGSVEAALRSLAALPVDGRKIAVLGPMAELGNVSDTQHESIGDLAELLNIELIGVDTGAYGGDYVDGWKKAIKKIGTIATGDAVLVKASRASALEQLVAALGRT